MRNHFLRAIQKSGGSNPWDISAATFTGDPVNELDLGGYVLSLTDAAWDSDGTLLIALNGSFTALNPYTTDPALQIGQVTQRKSTSSAAEVSSPTGFVFRSDGLKLYITKITVVYEYTLSTAWLVTSKSFVQSLTVSTQDNITESIAFKADGTKMYQLGRQYNSVYEYNLSTAWDISTASYSQSFSVSTQDANPTGLDFKSDGTVMYVVGTSSDALHQYNLSTAWDISTASLAQSTSLTSVLTNPSSVKFRSDGLNALVVDGTNKIAYRYQLSTAWDFSTASYTAPGLSFYNTNLAPSNLLSPFLSQDGSKLFYINRGADSIVETPLSTAWEISSAGSTTTASLTNSNYPTGLFFKDDGTKLYVANDAAFTGVNEYSLSTAWDVSTISYSQQFSTATQSTYTGGIAFSSDGTKMYVNTGFINQYDLSTAWDVSTASYTQAYNTGLSAADGIYFSSDGTKLFVVKENNYNNSDKVYEFSLSTAWDITTASQVTNKDVYGIGATYLFFKPDGTRLYISDITTGYIWSYDL